MGYMWLVLRKAPTLLAMPALAALVVAWPASSHTSRAPGDRQASASGTVVLRSFTASKAGRSVTLRWKTAKESDLLGYNIYRRQSRELRMRLIEQLIPAQNSADGASYTYGDQLTKAGPVRYRLQAVRGDGARAWLAYASAR